MPAQTWTLQARAPRYSARPGRFHFRAGERITFTTTLCDLSTLRTCNSAITSNARKKINAHSSRNTLNIGAAVQTITGMFLGWDMPLIVWTAPIRLEPDLASSSWTWILSNFEQTWWTHRSHREMDNNCCWSPCLRLKKNKSSLLPSGRKYVKHLSRW